MGECVFYLKADFPTRAKATEAKKKVKRLLKEAESMRNAKGIDWNHIEKSYPLFTEYLKDLKTQIYGGIRWV
jgi:hypothetical protein